MQKTFNLLTKNCNLIKKIFNLTKRRLNVVVKSFNLFEIKLNLSSYILTKNVQFYCKK